MIGLAQFMYGIDERPDAIRFDAGLDAMPQVEDMASAGTEIGQRLGD
jgi:hypothetical protein